MVNIVTVVDTILKLFIYSFLGWCCETAYCSIGTGKFVNRGFLNGPFCPVYGFGAMFTMFFVDMLPSQIIIVFLGGMLVTSSLEYFTSWLMEKLFHAKWWDYSTYKFNLNGRVCLLNSVLFGLLCLVLKFDIHPAVTNILTSCSFDFKFGFMTALMIYFLADLAVTVYSVLKLNRRISFIGKIRSELIDGYEYLNDRLNITEMLHTLQDKDVMEERIKQLKDKINDHNILHKRLLEAFPAYSSLSGNDAISAIKNAALKARAEKKQRKHK